MTYKKRLPFSYQAFFKGKLKIKGNMGLAMKLREIQPKAGKSKLQKADKYTTKESNTKTLLQTKQTKKHLMRTMKEQLTLLLSILDWTSVVCVTNRENVQILFEERI